EKLTLNRYDRTAYLKLPKIDFYQLRVNYQTLMLEAADPARDISHADKFYVVDAQRTGKFVYTIKAKSAIGVLDVIPYYGKLFVNTPLPDAIRDIILTDGMRRTETPFLMDLAESIVLGSNLDTVTVTGWIPVCTKREALHHILFAQGINILKAENDAFLISRISNLNAGEIDPNDEYEGGSVDLTERVKSVEVTEHSYVQSPNADPVVLYDNTETLVDLGTTVVFDSAPIVAASLSATGTLEILASNENCAIVTGVGTLTGIPYTHTTNVVSRFNSSNADGQSISVSDATMVNAVNSNAVADRLYDYYSQKREIKIPIVLSGERCGLKYSCTSPFGDKKDAFISSMSVTASAIAKADCKMISGYDPPERPGELTHLVVLTGSGVFKVPQEVLESDNPRIRLVLIGGGQGGQGGQSGEYGKTGLVNDVASLAKPGSPGINGVPGRIRMIQIDTKISEYYSYSCGCGGQGGRPVSYGEAQITGNMGEPTTFGDYSSEVGTIPEVGFIDPLSGNVYGGPSPDFSKVIRSGRGGGVVKRIDSEQSDGEYRVDPESGVIVVNEAIAEEYGVELGHVIEVRGGKSSVYEFSNAFNGYTGGGAGGPAINYIKWNYDNTGDGSHYYINGKNIYGGHGGSGSIGLAGPSPFAFSETAYGRGGIGGHGGGGGGSSGYLLYTASGYTVTAPTPGWGGAGGKGSDGAPGCILVYY
ncbi:MAG: hypothetical protein PUD70_03905, partial [Firmicutes bacterium]|nr:hypothetical protein [Bacillota bacterium]